MHKTYTDNNNDMPSPLPSLILASSSPYRRELLARLCLPFEVVPPNINETPSYKETPRNLALRLAVDKSKTVSALFPKCVVIGADQVASVGDLTIGKPGGFFQAYEQLRRFSGQTIDFHSAVAVTDGQDIRKASILTRCRFRKLSKDMIDYYLKKDTPYDVAGSVRVESLGISLIESLCSEDPTAIIGLPLISLTTLLGKHGFSPVCAANRLLP